MVFKIILHQVSSSIDGHLKNVKNTILRISGNLLINIV